MGKKVTSFTWRVNIGDYIRDDENRKEWVAKRCSSCNGSGLKNNGHTLTFECPTCEGTKVEWEEVKYGTN